MTPALLLSTPKAAKPLAIPMTAIRIAVSVRNHRSLEGNCDRFNVTADAGQMATPAHCPS